MHVGVDVNGTILVHLGLTNKILRGSLDRASTAGIITVPNFYSSLEPQISNVSDEREGGCNILPMASNTSSWLRKLLS